MSFQDFDKGNPKLPRHFKPSLIDDEFETPKDLYDSLCKAYNIYPTLDVCATAENKKCVHWYGIKENALECSWLEDAWMNDPHSLHEQFTRKAFDQWQKFNINILAIYPANCGRTTYWHRYIERHAEYHMIKGAIRFLQNGKPSKETSRNAYVVVVWRKR